jgi:divalent metal cation (Fe/Co/Zn/Cd) transporter
MMRKYIVALMLIFSGFLTNAQDKLEITEQDYANSQIEMADAFRAEGKIYVVIAVILVILLGLFLYLIIIDRKVSRLEKQLDKS